MAFLVPLHLSDDIVPDGGDARLIPFDARERRLQFLGIPELALAHPEDVRLRDGLVHVGPFHADALKNHSRNDDTR